jgi:hypothetical protein
VADLLQPWQSASLQFPHELLNYARFLEQGPAADPGDYYLFGQPRLRFEPRAEDVLHLVPETDLGATPQGSFLLHRPTQTRLELPGLSRDALARVLWHMRQELPLIELEYRARSTPEEMEILLRAAFGTLVLVPPTIERYQQQLDLLEIVRFPVSPYEVTRSYWDNMIAVREHLSGLAPLARDLESCWKHLRRLHLMCLMGADGRSYYRPSSPITGKNVAPGALYHAPSKTLRTDTTTWLIAGPRVSAPLVGGAFYHEMLTRSLGDPAALDDERSLVDEAGTPWGQLVLGRARGDKQNASWFLPPRPILHRHLAAIFRDLENVELAVAKRDLDGALPGLADFHWHFIRLHPFSCANQSLAMSVVSALLSRVGSVGIPHLILDQLALRLDRDPYRRVVARAVSQYGGTGAGAPGRWNVLREKREAMEEFLRLVADATDENERAELPGRYPEKAASALLVE